MNTYAMVSGLAARPEHYCRKYRVPASTIRQIPVAIMAIPAPAGDFLVGTGVVVGTVVTTGRVSGGRVSVGTGDAVTTG